MLSKFPTIAGIILFVSMLFRIFNLIRIAYGRMNEFYLKRVAKRTSIWFIGVQIILLGVASFVHILNFDSKQWLLYITTGQLTAAVGVLLITFKNIYKTRHIPLLERFSDKELPTITIAIPARNETDDLEACLQSIIANDYPKLEILVLDDCSQDKTPEIIRSFAHDGVRFLHGEDPSDRWLAKNQAYAKLATEASGEYIIFCGVDVRFGPQAIKALVTSMLNRQKKMISIMPLRSGGSMWNAFVQPTRYWWELSLPRKIANRPPVLSTCWIIERKALLDLGGFEAVSHAIIPEGFFARQLIKTNAYSFLRSDEVMNIETRKKPADQRDTAIRTLYPQIRRRPEMAFILTLVCVGLLLAPYVLSLVSMFVDLGSARWIALGATVALLITHFEVIRVTNPGNSIVALINYPVAVFVQLVLGLASMWQYEFSIVEWKGRNICIPVMHVIPKLPLVDKY